MCLIHHLVTELVLLLRVDLDAGRKGRVVAAEMVVVVEGGEGGTRSLHNGFCVATCVQSNRSRNIIH
jgi:hypothetical protein